jgi:thiamine-monophosphate kinase
MLPERQLISQLRRRFGSGGRDIALGIGDDCAILPVKRGEELLVTTDFSLEGVHFRREWQSPECIGHRCLARGLSDIAAMGGRPIAAFLSLALPSGISLKWVDKFSIGLQTLARKHQVELAGGDTAQSPGGVLADISVIGSVQKGKALLRSGARPGDQIYVTGDLGESAAAFQLLSTGKIRKRDVFPNPRLAVGEWLRTHHSASSAIDISDGLSTDLAHICEESGAGARIEAEVIPIHPKARLLDNAIELALHGGEDYELLFTAPRSRRVPLHIAGVKITRIGEMVRGRNLQIVRNGKVERLVPLGWEHFRKPREERTRSARGRKTR